MQNEINTHDLFPEPNPFVMERRAVMRYHRDNYVSQGGNAKRPDGSRRGRVCGSKARARGGFRGVQPNAIVALGLVILLAIAFGITAANANLGSGTGDAIWASDETGAVADDGSAVSTPKSDWKRGSVPMLFQTDPQWANKRYAGATIETHGCGPTCLSMVYVALTGKTDLDPKGMADFSTRCGYLEGEQTKWALMTEGAAQLGLHSEEMPSDVKAIGSALAGGTPMVFSMGPGDFTTDGHFIVACGVDGDGNFVVHDPNSVERSKRSWDPHQLLSQCRNIWAFSV